jgi:hypothetical protein
MKVLRRTALFVNKELSRRDNTGELKVSGAAMPCGDHYNFELQ